MDKGDLDGAATWRCIIDVIEVLLSSERGDALYFTNLAGLSVAVAILDIQMEIVEFTR